METLEGLIGNKLEDWCIVKMTEVYAVDMDGRRTVSLGCFKDSMVAAAYIESLKDSAFHKADLVLVLTNGKVGFALNDAEIAKLMDDDQIAASLKHKALGQLPPGMRELLGR